MYAASQDLPVRSTSLLPAVARSSDRQRDLDKVNYNVESGYVSGISDSKSDECHNERATKRVCRREVTSVVSSHHSYPRSAYDFWKPPLPLSAERCAIEGLTHAWAKSHDDSAAPTYKILHLDQFSIYRPNEGSRARELVSLERLTLDRFPKFVFDGILSFGGQRFFVQGVDFKVLTVDGYDDRDAIDLSKQLCIQSTTATAVDPTVFYQLGQPAPEYARFYEPFLWLARFAKHFVDYLLESHAPTIALHHFETRFHRWLCARYEKEEVISWLEEAYRKDFRQTVVAHVEFLWKECVGLDDKSLLAHPIWTEIGPHAGPRALTAIPKQPIVEARTIVTPFAYMNFRPMYFGSVLEERLITDKALKRELAERKVKLGLTPNTLEPSQHQDTFAPVLKPVSTIKVGDIVALPVEEHGKWQVTGNNWYAYVQGVVHCAGPPRLEIIWLYHPSDTILGAAQYPFSNELFMSDNCGCDRSRVKDAINLDAVLGKIDVEWHPEDPLSCRKYFVRRTYRTMDEDFVLFRKDHLRCQCGQPQLSPFEGCQKLYGINETVLIRSAVSSTRLEPVQILRYDGATQKVEIRRFRRRDEDIQDGSFHRPMNEVTPTEEISTCLPQHIVRRCHIKTFGKKIHPPYESHGAGDLCFVRGDEHSRSPSLIDYWEEGLDFSVPVTREPLIGLGLFCGGGAFDRGLEDGGAVEFQHAVDWDTLALHSHRANARKSTTYFLGSVDDYLARAMAGGDEHVARPGTINLCAAGSPCQGFSTMQSDKMSLRSLQNASKVASVVSFVDLYAPEYLLLENVRNMCGDCGPDKTQPLFRQIMAALVALGYQVQTTLVESRCFGSCQNRERVFIIISAPGLEPIVPPPHTHSHPPGEVSARKLGTLSNGESFGNRLVGPTPFKMRQAGAAVADLPNIGDGLVRICPQFPDHRTPIDLGAKHRTRIVAVPRYPRGLSLRHVLLRGRLRGEPLEWAQGGNKLRGRKASKAYARIDPERLFPTILTNLSPCDAIKGPFVHWDQDRTITVMEARRAQGYPDNEILIGTPSQQLHTIGNSVDRYASFPFGFAIRRSWLASQRE